MNKQQATRAGKALLRRMKGHGWKLRVYENLGWHYSVETNRIHVVGPSHPGEETFMALMSPHYSYFSGEVQHRKDPNKAVKILLAGARARADELMRTVQKACEELYGR